MDGELYRDDCNKVSFILNSYQDHLDSIKEFPDLKPGTWGGAGEIALFGDLGVKGIDKAHAIDDVLNHLLKVLQQCKSFLFDILFFNRDKLMLSRRVKKWK